MKEAAKTKRIRSEDFYRTYMSGSVLDIGSGGGDGAAEDLCVPHAVPFDKAQGDANRILEYLKLGSFDCVHSSHCLEHMHDPKKAIADWWQLVRPGGYLVTIVPDEDLYEQGNWPSFFNYDHKSTFRLGGDVSWSPVSHEVRGLIAALPGAEIVFARREDEGYVHGTPRFHPRHKRFLARIFRNVQRIAYMLSLKGTFADRAIARTAIFLGVPYDQSAGDALSQIEVVARKKQQ